MKQENKEVSEMGVCEFCGIEQPLSNLTCHYKVCSQKVIPSNVPVSVEDMHDIAEKHRMDEGWTDDINTVYTGGFLSGAKWKAKQDKAIIAEMLEALKMMYETVDPQNVEPFKPTSLTKNGNLGEYYVGGKGTPSDEAIHKSKSAITKAENHLSK